MPVSDIYSGNALIQPKSIQDFDNENLLMQQKRQSIQAGTLAMQGTQMDLQQRQNVLSQRAGMASALQGGQVDLANPQHVANLSAQFPDVAPGFLKTVQEGNTSRALAGKDTAQAAHANAQAQGAITDNTIKATEFMARSLPGVTNPQQLADWYKHGIDQKLITPEQAQQEFAQIPINDPAAMKQWISNKTQEGVATVEKMKMEQQAKLAADVNKTHIQTTAMTNATSRANNTATIAKDYKVAGIDPQTGNFVGAGSGDAGGMAGLVDAIGKGQVSQTTALARVPPAMKATILAQVAEKYPEWTPGTFDARVQSLKAYGAGGKETPAIQAANTALNHLDTIQQLAAAQKNGNYPLFNKIANQIAAQTGQPAPTNLNAAISMVAPELTKAVVGTGGGVGERADFAHNLNPNGSPDQILGGVATIQELMGGRLTEAARTYERTTGKKDFAAALLSPAAQRVVSSRSHSDASASVPDDIAAILKKHGPK